MKTKRCKICGHDKYLKDFNLRKDSKDGYRNECKDCLKFKNKEYYKTNNKRIKYRIKNKDKIKQTRKIHYIKNKDRLNKISKEWRACNKEKVKEYNKNYRIEKINKVRELKRINYNERIRNDGLFKLKCNLRGLIRISLKRFNFTKNSKTFEILGCSYDRFKKYLFEKAKLRYIDFKEQDFMEGKYHIDHIIPISFAKNEEEVLKLNHYTNFQLLTAEENLAKSNKMILE